MYAVAVDPSVLASMMTNTGKAVTEISNDQPILLVFLRHFGCIFCQEAMRDIADQRERIEASGVQIVFVHMGTSQTADKYFKRYSLAALPHVSDPECDYYSRFGLVKGNASQLYGLQNWIRGFANVDKVPKMKYNPKMLGDATQMPGIFLIHKGEIKESYIHRYASDRPDYNKIVSCCLS